VIHGAKVLKFLDGPEDRTFVVFAVDDRGPSGDLERRRFCCHGVEDDNRLSKTKTQYSLLYKFKVQIAYCFGN
jgi:hypothetical protein